MNKRNTWVVKFSWYISNIFQNEKEEQNNNNYINKTPHQKEINAISYHWGLIDHLKQLTRCHLHRSTICRRIYRHCLPTYSLSGNDPHEYLKIHLRLYYYLGWILRAESFGTWSALIHPLRKWTPTHNPGLQLQNSPGKQTKLIHPKNKWVKNENIEMFN